MVTAFRVVWVAVLGLALVGSAGSLTPVAAQGCPTVGGTPYFTIAYGPLQLDGADAPVGAVVEAVSPRGDVAGCFEVTTTGHYGAMYVYGEDTSVTPSLPGMQAGEEIAFRINGAGATATPPLDWQNDRDLHEVGLAATSPPMPVTDLSASALGSHLELTWTAVTHNTAGQPITGVTYRVYRGENAPYFVPGGVPHGTTASTTFIDANALGDPATNYTYLVTAVSATGSESAASARVGEFDLALVPGPSATERSYNFVTLVLDVPGLIRADDLANYVGSGTVYQVMHYDAADQGFTPPDNVWLPDFEIFDNFELQVGQVYGLHLNDTAPTNLCLIGTVPPEGSVAFALTPGDTGPPLTRKYNYISLPFDRDDLALADNLAGDIGVGDVYQVMQYDTQDQGFTPPDNIWLPGFEIFTDFGLRIGYPYMVQLEPGAPTTWPVY